MFGVLTKMRTMKSFLSNLIVFILKCCWVTLKRAIRRYTDWHLAFPLHLFDGKLSEQETVNTEFLDNVFQSLRKHEKSNYPLKFSPHFQFQCCKKQLNSHPICFHDFLWLFFSWIINVLYIRLITSLNEIYSHLSVTPEQTVELIFNHLEAEGSL